MRQRYFLTIVLAVVVPAFFLLAPVLALGQGATPWTPCAPKPGSTYGHDAYCRGNVMTPLSLPSLPIVFIHNSVTKPGEERAGRDDSFGYGKGWTSNLDSYLVRLDPDRMKLVDGDGSVVAFLGGKVTDGAWWDVSELRPYGSGYLRRVDDHVFVYSAAGSRYLLSQVYADPLATIGSGANELGELLLSLERDAASGRIATLRQGSKSARFSYNDAGKLSSIVDYDGLTYEFSVETSLNTATLPDGTGYTFLYDNEFNITGIEGPGRTKTSYGYYSEGVVRSVSQLGLSASFSYSPSTVAIDTVEGRTTIEHSSGAYTSITSPFGRVQVKRGARGAPVEVTDTQGLTTRYTVESNAITVTDPFGGAA